MKQSKIDSLPLPKKNSDLESSLIKPKSPKIYIEIYNRNLPVSVIIVLIEFTMCVVEKKTIEASKTKNVLFMIFIFSAFYYQDLC